MNKKVIIMNFQGKTVLITGGASGIGKLMGKMALEKGAGQLIIWDINEPLMIQTVGELQSYGNVAGFTCNLSDTDSIRSAFEKTTGVFPEIDVLINNAGVVVGKYFDEHSLEDIRLTMEINAIAPMYLIQLFLPVLKQRPQACVCNIASSAGLISNPKMSVYVASKWSLLGFSDSIYIEFKHQKYPIGVTTVTPYYINTGMFDGVKSFIPIIKPEKAAKKIIRGIEKNKRFVSMPWTIRMIRLLQAALPASWFDKIAGDWMGIYHTMDAFKGRKS